MYLESMFRRSMLCLGRPREALTFFLLCLQIHHLHAFHFVNEQPIARILDGRANEKHTMHSLSQMLSTKEVLKRRIHSLIHLPAHHLSTYMQCLYVMFPTTC